MEAYDPRTGELWMSVDCMAGEVAPSPASTNGLVFATNQYAILVAIDPIAEEIVWETTDNLPDVSSPLAADGLLWLPSADGVTCLDAASGDLLWQEEFGEGFYASPVLAAGNVYLLDRAGTMHIFKAAREYEPVATATLGEQSVCTPAFSDGRIYLRGESHLFCFEKP